MRFDFKTAAIATALAVLVWIVYDLFSADFSLSFWEYLVVGVVFFIVALGFTARRKIT